MMNQMDSDHNNSSPKFQTKENLAQNGSYILENSVLGKRDKS